VYAQCNNDVKVLRESRIDEGNETWRHVNPTCTLRGRRVMETLPLLNTPHVTFPPFTLPTVTDIHHTTRSGRFLVRKPGGDNSDCKTIGW
jgi:hypothetical protein